MIDFANIAFRTVMSLAFLAFVVRPLLMSMVRKEPNTLELEEMAQLAVNSAFKSQFNSYYASRPQKLPAPEKLVIDVQATPVGEVDQAHTPLVPLTEEELAALAQFDVDEAERVRGHAEEMARRASLAAEEAARKADEAAQRLALEAAGAEDEEEDEGLKKMRENMKKEKKKPTIPAELLAGNSYEDKLMIVRLVTDHFAASTQGCHDATGFQGHAHQTHQGAAALRLRCAQIGQGGFDVGSEIHHWI